VRAARRAPVGPTAWQPPDAPGTLGLVLFVGGVCGAAVALRCGGRLVPLPALTAVAGDPRETRLTAPPGL